MSSPAAADVRRRCFRGLNPSFSFGGQISIDAFPQGWDKTYCLHFLEHVPTFHFFGRQTRGRAAAVGLAIGSLQRFFADFGHPCSQTFVSRRLMRSIDRSRARSSAKSIGLVM